MTQQIIDAYLDYVNNFISWGAFAEHYGLSDSFALATIQEGRRLHEERVALARS